MVYCSPCHMKIAIIGVLCLLGQRGTSIYGMDSHMRDAKSSGKDCTLQQKLH